MAQKPEDISKRRESLPIKEIPFDQVKLEHVLGHGTFGFVYHAKLDEKEIAVKTMKLEKPKQPREITIHELLPPHINILTPLGVAYNPAFGQLSYLCMELATKSLYQRLHQEATKPSHEESTKWALQIARGMQHLHTYDVVHRDLKSHNVLLFAEENIKLCDFGCARFLKGTDQQTQVTGTVRWIAPEIQESAKAQINKACDVFSYGMILYELFDHQIPFYHVEDGPKVTKLIQNNKRPRIPSSLPSYFKHLMQGCWEHNSRDRPEFQAIVRAQENKVFTHQIKTAQFPEPPDETDNPPTTPSIPMPLKEANVRQIDKESIKVNGLIHKEKSGSVYKGTWNGKPVVIKKISLENSCLPRECIIHASISHNEGIVDFLGVALMDDYEAMMIMEHTEGSISNYLQKNKLVLTVDQSLAWALQVARGMEHLHSHNIIHRDLKAANIHLSAGNVAKIRGFGVARYLDGPAKQSGDRGTPRWMAPEVMEQANALITPKCDVFSYGMLLYEFFVHKCPFENLAEIKASMKIVKGERPNDFPSSVPKYIQRLIQDCWSDDANKRPTFNEVQSILAKKD